MWFQHTILWCVLTFRLMHASLSTSLDASSIPRVPASSLDSGNGLGGSGFLTEENRQDCQEVCEKFSQESDLFDHFILQQCHELENTKETEEDAELMNEKCFEFWKTLEVFKDPKTTKLQYKQSSTLLTLQHPICQRALSFAVYVLSAEEVNQLIERLPIEVLSNVEIISQIQDFRQVHSLEHLVQLFQDCKIWSEVLIQDQLSKEQLFAIVEARNFDLAADELCLIMKVYPSFIFEDPSDHRSFPVFNGSFRNVFFMWPVQLEQELERHGLTGSTSVVETILAVYYQTEAAIQMLFDLLSKNYFILHANDAIEYAYMSPEDVAKIEAWKLESFMKSSAFFIVELTKWFATRNRMLLLVVKHPEHQDLLKLLQTPAGQFLRNAIASSNEGNIQLNAKSSLQDQFQAFWQFSQSNPHFGSLYHVPLPYSTAFVKEFQSPEGFLTLLTGTAGKLCSPAFSKGIWMKNFILHAIHPLNPDSESLMARQPSLLHVLERFSDVIGEDVRSKLKMSQHDKFLRPLARLAHRYFSDSSTDREASLKMKFQAIRELRSILKDANFDDETFLEEIWKCPHALRLLTRFPQGMCDFSINQLLDIERGREFLRGNPEILSNLPPCFASRLQEHELNPAPRA